MVKRNIYTVDNSRCMASATRARPAGASPITVPVPPLDRTASNPPMPDSGIGSGCGAGSGSVWGLDGYPLAQVYAPLQSFSDIYTPERGLSRGTIFAELDLPIGVLSPHSDTRGGARNG